MAKTPTEALTTNAIAEAHIVAKNRFRKNMKNLLALTCKPKKYYKATFRRSLVVYVYMLHFMVYNKCWMLVIILLFV